MLQEKGIDKARGILLFSWLQSKSRLLHLAELPNICHDPSRRSSLPSFIFNGVSLAQAGLRATVQLRMNLDSQSPCLHFLTARPLQAAEDVNVTFEDQQKINKFARNTSRITELKEEIEVKKPYRQTQGHELLLHVL
ncbi:prefoldin subunit 4 isoform X1 [Alexandromys fortis]|uniref:prefoldin subunit 4 isoform X1 n=1 Tax=Alexandromys fortis TaxID=100897 RepID=UPI002152611F|nr:prefoldin subunit 4 isoform X1 [Microtus fortis]